MFKITTVCGRCFNKAVLCGTILSVIGDWPSGKATGSGPVIGGSNPSSPAKESDMIAKSCYFLFDEKPHYEKKYY